MTGREVVIALYEINDGDWERILDDMKRHHHYLKDDLEKAVAKFNEKHQGQRVVTILDADYPMEFRSNYVNPPFVVICSQS